MEPMDKLFDLYNRHIDQPAKAAHELNTSFSEPASLPIQRKSRQEFEVYVSGPPSESKRYYLMGLVADQNELLQQLPLQMAAGNLLNTRDG